MARSGEARRIRVEAGLSLRDLASDIGVAHTTLGRWETGEAAPRRRAALAWHRRLEEITSVLAEAWRSRAQVSRKEEEP